MRLRHILQSLFAIICVFLCACGNGTSNNAGSTRPDDYDMGNSITLGQGYSMIDGIYKMRESKGDTWACRISVPSWTTIGEFGNITLVDSNKYADFAFKKISKSKDQMIIVGITGVSYTEILDTGYTIPYMVTTSNGDYVRSRIGTLVGDVYHPFEKINKQDPAVYFQSRMSAYGPILKAKNRGETFTFGYYSGTKFLEETYSADTFYCVKDNGKWKGLPITKTTEGYFIADFSALTPGQYVFKCGQYDNTIIEVCP